MAVVSSLLLVITKSLGWLPPRGTDFCNPVLDPIMHGENGSVKRGAAQTPDE
jgi:hypothetical protein